VHDVVIVGAGPVGLFLAGELGLAGCSVLMLEREPEARSASKEMPLGMRGLSAASVEAFHRRGMLGALLTASGAGDAPRRNGGHFAGIMIDPDRIDASALPEPGFEGLLTSLDAVESVLAERAVALGVEIRRGVTVSAVSQDDGTVTAHDGEHAYPARWLVGCDGGRSVTRGLAGFDFAGTEPQFTGYTMVAGIADPEKLRLGFTLTPGGMYIRTPAPGHVAMMDFDGGAYDRSQRPTREHLQAVLRRVSGTDVTLTEVRLVSTYTDRARQATDYRRGRVLLAGDAAHIHSPLGGQGLNLGLGDVMNLGWKLAATVHGTAPDGLLDTYTRERHPVGAQVLEWSRAQVAVMQPGGHAPALQAMMRDLLGTRDGTTYLFNRASGLRIRYDLGGGHPLVGRNATDPRLGELLRDGCGVLLDLSGDHAVTGWENRIRYAAGKAEDDPGVDAVLVRPDGVVAWAGDRASFDRAAQRWFGDPVG
jgi:2-polyprenyl-6-methoxyphenol hydroxylase-like FAD-dependent oxidoreductase